MERVRVLLSLKRFDRAEKVLHELADGDELTQKLSYAIFCLHLHGPQALERVESIAKEVMKRPENRSAEVYGCLGVIAQTKGEVRTAESMYRLALTLDKYSRWRNPLAELLIRSARYKEAETELNEILRVDPSSVSGRYWLGVLQYESGLVRESEFTFRSALAIDPWHPGSICGLAVSLVAQNHEAAAERELTQAVDLLSKDENDVVLLRLASVLIQRGDQTGNDSYYDQAATEAKKIFDDPDPYLWGLRKEDVRGEAHYILGVAYYKIAESALEPRTISRFQRRAQREFNSLKRMKQLARYPDARRLRESLPRTHDQAARVALSGYVTALVCLVLVGLLWYKGFIRGGVSDTLIATLTPILVGLAAVAMLYPILARLKLPGFEADIRQPELHPIAPSPEAVVTFGTAFLGASPRDIVKHEYGGWGAFALAGCESKMGVQQPGSEPSAAYAAAMVTAEAGLPGMPTEPADRSAALTPRSAAISDGGIKPRPSHKRERPLRDPDGAQPRA